MTPFKEAAKRRMINDLHCAMPAVVVVVVVVFALEAHSCMIMMDFASLKDLFTLEMR